MSRLGEKALPAILCLSVFLSAACSGPGEQESRRAAEPSPEAKKTDATGDGEPRLILTPVIPASPPQRPPAPPRPPAPRRPAPAPPPPPAAPLPAVVPPAPAQAGTFLFAETGITRIRGCLTLDQPPPSPTRLIVAPPAGNRQHLDRDQRDRLGGGSTAVLDVEYRPDGIYLTNLRQTQTSLLSSQPTEFQPNPPVLLLPAGATAGQAWSFSLVSRDGGVKIDSQNRVEALDEQVTLGNGRAVGTRRVLADSRITGQSSQGTLDLTRRMTTWYSPESGLPVKEIVDLKGRIGLCEIDSHTEATMQAL